MSLTTTQSLAQFAVASLGQAFNIPFEIQNASDLVVTDTNGTTSLDTALTLNTDYFVTGAATNGVILNPVVTLENTGLRYAVGDTLTIQRKPPATQPTTYVDGTKYLAATTNNALDWIVYQVQALLDIAARCLQVPATSAAASVPPMPLTARKNTILGFDSNGNLAFLPLTTLATGFQMNTLITGLTGGGATKLDGYDATGLTAGYVMEFVQTGPGARQFQLQVSSAATGPTVVAALNQPTMRWISIL